MSPVRDQTASDWLEFRPNAQIVRLARAGHPPMEIEALTGIPVTTIHNKLRRARELGLAIAKFGPNVPRRERPSRAGEDRKPQPAAPASPRPCWSADDDRQLAALLRRDVRLTAAAAFLRRPYAEITRAAERLGLTRTRQMET